MNEQCKPPVQRGGGEPAEGGGGSCRACCSRVAAPDQVRLLWMAVPPSTSHVVAPLHSATHDLPAAAWCLLRLLFCSSAPLLRCSRLARPARLISSPASLMDPLHVLRALYGAEGAVSVLVKLFSCTSERVRASTSGLQTQMRWWTCPCGCCTAPCLSTVYALLSYCAVRCERAVLRDTVLQAARLSVTLPLATSFDGRLLPPPRAKQPAAYPSHRCAFGEGLPRSVAGLVMMPVVRSRRSGNC